MVRPRINRLPLLARWATSLIALWKLLRHAQTPRPIKLLAVGVLVYVVSPVDLLPDVVPGLGLVDDLVLVPLAVSAIRRLTPPALWDARWQEAERVRARLPAWWRALLVALAAALVAGLGWVAWTMGTA